MKSEVIFETSSEHFGKIANDRKIVKLFEICVEKNGVQTGPFGSQLHQRDYVEKGTPIMTVEHLGENEIIHKNIPKVSKSDYERLLKYTLKEGDIVFSRVGSVDRSSIIRSNEKSWLYSGRCLRIRPNHEKILPEYLSWFFQYSKFKEYIRRIAVGAVMLSLNTKLMENIEIILPPIENQKKIVIILNSIHYEIQNFKKQNKILEQISKSIFKSWFIDFDRVTKFEDSELGKIPKHWKVSTLSDFITLDKGISYQGKFLTINGTPMINLGNISKNGNFIDKKIKNYSGEFKTRHLISSGDIVIANTDITQDRQVLGSPAIVPPLNSEEIIFTHHVFAVRNNSNLGRNFLYNLLQTNNYHSNVIGYATGTTVLAISKEAVLDFRFILPNVDLLNKFEKISSYMYNEILSNKSEIQNLTKIRDLLLPKLISGEIRV